MIALVLRGLARRRLRSALTAIAIVLGVSMISGTSVLTGQIRDAFTGIEETANAGVDAAIAPRTAFTSSVASAERLDAGLVDRAAAVPGVARAQGQLSESGALVVNGRTIQPRYAPSLVLSALAAQFDPMRLTRGRTPRARGEIMVNTGLANTEHLRLGQRLGVSTRTGIRPVQLVGTADYGTVASIGGATLIIAPLADVQAWFRRAGQVSTIAVAAADGVSPRTLVGRLRTVMPPAAEVKTGGETAQDAADSANDAIGAFLTPLLTAFSLAALLVGAFIIFNTFSVTVTERRREFALLRAIGTTRTQLMGVVVGEAMLLGVAASVTGLAGGLGFAWLLGALFDLAGTEIPRAGLALTGPTVALALVVGLLTTTLAAAIPALRATRVSPVAALRDEAVAPSRRARIARRLLAAAVPALGVGLLLLGLLGSAPATTRMGILGAGGLVFFVGVALGARVMIRPLAAITGWPLKRFGSVAGELAEENAARNPGRTAVTAAALTIGLGLVVFVAVLASGLKTSMSAGLQERFADAGLVVVSANFTPLPRAVGTRLAAVPGVAEASPQYGDQVQVDGRPVKLLTDVLNGIDPASFAQVYRFRWSHGSDAALADLRPGEAILERQFAQAHGIAVGERFSVGTAAGHHRTLTAVAEYRDPQVLQGALVDVATFRALTPGADPLAYYAALAPGADATQARVAATRALTAFPSSRVRTLDEYAAWMTGQLDSVVYLLYALLAMSVVISLFGIANSLFLSITERTPELGMLRAVGATAGQIRQVIRGESMITSLIGGVLGILTGLLFAWLMTFALSDLGLAFHVPALQLVVFLAVAVLVGWLASVAPARRAGRLDIVSAISAD